VFAEQHRSQQKAFPVMKPESMSMDKPEQLSGDLIVVCGAECPSRWQLEAEVYHEHSQQQPVVAHRYTSDPLGQD
jgi:hypothetical protein